MLYNIECTSFHVVLDIRKQKIWGEKEMSYFECSVSTNSVGRLLNNVPLDEVMEWVGRLSDGCDEGRWGGAVIGVVCWSISHKLPETNVLSPWITEQILANTQTHHEP